MTEYGKGIYENVFVILNSDIYWKLKSLKADDIGDGWWDRIETIWEQGFKTEEIYESLFAYDEGWSLKGKD